MKRRPLSLILIGVILILSPIVYYADAAIRHQIPFSEFARVWGSISFGKLVGVLMAPLVGLLVLWVKQASWYAMIGYCAYTILNNLVRAHEHQDYQFLAFSITGVLAILYFVRREIRSPYFHPRLRWWEPDVRLPAKLQVDLAGHGTVACTTYDISATGAFLVTDLELKCGEKLELGLHFGDRLLVVSGTVVWCNAGSPARPKGVGIRFAKRYKEIAAMMRGLRRREPRVQVALKVAVDGRPDLSGVTHDISSRGCFLVTEVRCEVGEQLKVAIDFKGTSISVAGTVVWNSETASLPAGIGVAFAPPTSEMRQAVRELRRAHPPRQGVSSVGTSG